jgi:HlyD family secretion protein
MGETHVKAKKRKRRILWSISAIVIITIAGLVGCGIARQRSQAAAPSADDTVTVFVGDLAASASASGQLLPQREAQLALGVSGHVEHVSVGVGDRVRAGDALVLLESGDLQRAVESAEQNLAIQEANLAELRRPPDPQDVAAAEASAANAQAQLDDLLAGPSAQEQAQAQASLDSAQAQLDDLLAGPSQDDLAQAQAALISAKASLQAARARYEALDDQLVVAQNDIHNAQIAIDGARDMYDQLIWRQPEVATSWGPYSPQAAAKRSAQIGYDVAVANYALTEINVNDTAVRSAQAQVAQAENTLAALTEEKTVQIAAAEAQVARAKANQIALTEEQSVQIAAARAQLAQAAASLAKLLDGASEEQLSIAEAQTEQARIALEEARDNLDAATLTAPFAGTITAVHIAVGEYASGLAVELVDTESLRVVLDVDEVDIGTIRVGQPTRITLETWPDRDIAGEVVSIAPKAKNLGGIVSYEVQLSLDAAGLPVLTGMTANADLITAQRENVLLVPNRAIIADRAENRYYVNRIEGQEIVKVEVTIGLRDNTYTEVTTGLAQGDLVYIGTVDEGFGFAQGPPSGMREVRAQ